MYEIEIRNCNRKIEEQDWYFGESVLEEEQNKNKILFQDEIEEIQRTREQKSYEWKWKCGVLICGTVLAVILLILAVASNFLA